MFWLRGLMLCDVLLLAHCYIRDFKGRCTAGQHDFYPYDGEEGERRPQPPEIGHSYIAKYEMNSFHATHSAWVEEYFDYHGKRAKISASVLGMEFVDLYDYGRGTVTSYRLSRPEKSGWSSKIVDTCKTVEMADFEPAFQVLSYPVPKTTKRGPQIMVTADRAFKYGPSYNYTFYDERVGVETRNIRSDIFTGCINEDYLNYSLRSDFYWGTSLPFSYPSGEDRIPLFIEMRGPDVHDARKEVYVMKYVPWYQKDPKFTPEMFQIPKGLHCKYFPNRARLPNMPSSFSYSFEETQFQLDSSGFLQGGFQSSSDKQVWYDHDLKLARLDMRPSAEDLKELDLRSGDSTFEFISVLFDLGSGFTYFSNTVTSECWLMRNDTTFFWKHKNGTLKSPEELFGITSRLQYKGKDTVMGAEVEVWTELMNDTNKSTITKRDLSFSTLDKKKDTYSNKYVFSLLQESIYKEKYKQVQSVRDFSVQNVRVKNFIEFNSNAPEQHVFGQHACIPDEPAGSYYINFKPVNACALDSGNKTRFLKTLRVNLAAAAGLRTLLPLQNLVFRWIQTNGTSSVGFTFHEGIQGEETNETAFAASAKEKAASFGESITVSFRLTAASTSDACSWKSYSFYKISRTIPQTSTASTLQTCTD